jgi:hypothetical protein
MERSFPDSVEEAEISMLIGIRVFGSTVGTNYLVAVGMWESLGPISIQITLKAMRIDADGIYILM